MITAARNYPKNVSVSKMTDLGRDQAPVRCQIQAPEAGNPVTVLT